MFSAKLTSLSRTISTDGSKMIPKSFKNCSFALLALKSKYLTLFPINSLFVGLSTNASDDFTKQSSLVGIQDAFFNCNKKLESLSL